MSPADEHPLIARLFINGQLVDEQQLTSDAEADRISTDQRQRAEDAAAHGGVWMVEIENPDVEPEVRFVRFGTDETLMVKPLRA